MSNAAIEFINVIASNLVEVNKPLYTILYFLEDGAVLEMLGVTDEDQEMVEEAHGIVSDWIEDGREFL